MAKINKTDSMKLLIPDDDGSHNIDFSDTICPEEIIDYRMIDLGCGRWRKKSHLGFDNLEAADFQGMTESDKKWIVQWDLNRGIPYPDNVVDDVYMGHALEHMNDPDFIIREIWRVCHDKAHVTFVVPLHEMDSVGHITEFSEYWFEQRILDKFPGMFALVRKGILKDKPVETRKSDGTTFERTFDELTIVLRIVK